MANGISDKHLRIALAGLDDQISQLKEKIVELEEAKQALRSQFLDGDNAQSLKTTTSKTRLRPGVANKWVGEALKAGKPLSIVMIMDYTEEHKNLRLKDAPIRRALYKFRDDGKVRSHEDGTWEWIEHTIDPEPPHEKTVVDKDDDLPF